MEEMDSTPHNNTIFPSIMKLSFKSRFAQNPVDKNINKMDLLQAMVDRKQAKELLISLDKNYHIAQMNVSKNIDYDDIHNDIESYIQELIEDRLNKPYIDLQFRKLLRKFALEGQIPSHLRKDVWMIASGARAKMIKNSSYYKALKSDKISYPPTFLHSIELDLKRTFPDKPWYENNDPYVEKMRNILSSYSKRNPVIGYCQGLNFIMAKLLQVVPDEEEAFWLLTSLIETYIPTDYFSNMEGVLVDQQIFQDMIALNYPDLLQKFNELQIDSSLISLQWFVCLYTSALPDSLLFSMWDLLILDGSSVLFKTGLFMIDKLQREIKNVTELHEIFILLEEKSKHLIHYDISELLHKFQTTYINKQLLNFLRELYRFSVRKKIIEMENKKVRRYSVKLDKENKPCQTEWPVCIDLIATSEKSRPKSLFVYRVNKIKDYIIVNYFDIQDESPKQRINSYTDNTISSSSHKNHVVNITGKSQKTSEFSSPAITNTSFIDGFNLDGLNDVQNFEKSVIGRQVHICEQSQLERMSKKAEFDEKALSEEYFFQKIQDSCKPLHSSSCRRIGCFHTTINPKISHVDDYDIDDVDIIHNNTIPIRQIQGRAKHPPIRYIDTFVGTLIPEPRKSATIHFGISTTRYHENYQGGDNNSSKRRNKKGNQHDWRRKWRWWRNENNEDWNRNKGKGNNNKVDWKGENKTWWKEYGQNENHQQGQNENQQQGQHEYHQRRQHYERYQQGQQHENHQQGQQYDHYQQGQQHEHHQQGQQQGYLNSKDDLYNDTKTVYELNNEYGSSSSASLSYDRDSSSLSSEHLSNGRTYSSSLSRSSSTSLSPSNRQGLSDESDKEITIQRKIMKKSMMTITILDFIGKYQHHSNKNPILDEIFKPFKNHVHLQQKLLSKDSSQQYSSSNQHA